MGRQGQGGYHAELGVFAGRGVAILPYEQCWVMRSAGLLPLVGAVSVT